MNKKILNILLWGCLVILLASFWIINKNSSINLDYYQLNETHFLHKIDYFSSYAVAKFENGIYEDIIPDINGIALTPDSIIVRSFRQNVIQYFLLQNIDKEYIKLDDSDSVNSTISNYTFVKPWQIVEKKSITSNYRLINQLIIIAIILLAMYLTMKVFNIKKLVRK